LVEGHALEESRKESGRPLNFRWRASFAGPRLVRPGKPETSRGRYRGCSEKLACPASCSCWASWR
jgi:hypothetical protein